MNNVQKMLEAILTPMQDVENALLQCLNERTLDNAKGVNLDVLGKLVGEPRAGRDDETYRRFIRTRIKAHRSSGTVEQLIAIAKLIVNDPAATCAMTNYGHASELLEIQGVATSDAVAAIILSFMLDSQAAGVRTEVEYGIAAPSTWMQWDVAGRGWDGHKWVGSIG